MLKKYTPLALLIILLLLLVFLSLTLENGQFDFNWTIIQLIRLPEVVILIIGTIATTLGTLAIHLLTKNKIADLSIIGMTGINLLLLTIIFAALSYDLFLKIESYVMPLAYLGGSLLILSLIYLLTFKFPNSSEKIILIGIVLTLTLSAISQMILAGLSSGKQAYLNRFGVGFLASETDILIAPSSFIAYGALGIALILFVIFSRKIVIVYSDFEKAHSIGINIKLVRAILFIIISLAATASFICFGAVAFIGFIATNIVYLFWKKVGIIQAFLSLMTGLVLMLIVYLLQQSSFLATVPLGIATNIIALPYLVFVLWKGEKHDR